MAAIEDDGGKRNTRKTHGKKYFILFSLRQKKVISKTAEVSRSKNRYNNV